MVTIAFVVATFLMPISACLLFLLIFPYAPMFLLRRFSKYLWDLCLTVNSYRFKLVHLMLVLSLVLCVSKGHEYYELLNHANLHPEMALALDLKMKLNRCGRDFYIMGNLLAIWIYIWRIIPLVSKIVN